jgi:hypothetical protein
MAGCKKKSDSEDLTLDVSKAPDGNITKTMSMTPMPTIEATPTIDPLEQGLVRSKITGEWVTKEVAESRPYAVMINNIIYANPQSGTSDADILYEAIVEGGITRLMGIFEGIDPNSLTAKRLGSVRSARHYFVSFADEYDAIFVHYGQTSYAIKKINELGIDTISGMAGVGVNSFYRDKNIEAPHNAFTSLKGLESAVKKGKYRTTYEEGYEAHYSFYEEDTDLNTTQTAIKITLKFSKQITPVLTYDKETKEYLRFQYNGEHIDYNTKKQLSFKNVIVQFVKEWNIDKNGYQTMELDNATGEGYYITNGKVMNITWKKDESTRIMRYYDENGDELTINPGKTYIAIFPNNRVNDVAIES